MSLKRRSASGAGGGGADNRTIFVGDSFESSHDLMQDPPPVKPQYESNVIKTSKYEWWSFVPKNLFEQFRRIANCFFLLVAVVQLSTDSPVSPFPSVFSLCFVISVTALKQGLEDYMRHRADAAVNNTPTVVVRDGKLMTVRASEVEIGDVVKVNNEETIPCDMVLISSVNDNGSCFVTTANLDGETNLKQLETPPSSTQKFSTPTKLKDLKAIVECEQPHADMYKFVGRLTIGLGQNKKIFPLNAPNLLVSGSTLKETDFIYGVSVYSGQQTKMMLNLKITANKFSTAEKTMNKIIVVLIAYLALEILVCAVYHHSIDEFVVQRESGISKPTKWSDFLLFLVIYNYVVPVALYVSIEFQKFIGANFFRWDNDMREGPDGEWPVCNTSDISEELGQINYLFSDKTGTLTENTMEFRMAAAGTKSYLMSDGDLVDKIRKEKVTEPDAELEQLIVNMVVNHTVVVDNKSKKGDTEGELVYKASSPDEKAFVEAAASMNIVFQGVDKEAPAERLVNYRGKLLRFHVRHILDFDPTRKCMSIIVKDIRNGQIILMTKGAESSLEPKIVSGPKQEAYRHLESFAAEGLRTLVFAQRYLTESEYEEFDRRLVAAQNALEDREAKLSAEYASIESGLTVVGATGIEDLLQEGVKDTLVSLNRAGVRVWVLTGDKKSTAINISYSCGHFDRSMTVHELTDVEDDTGLAAALEKLEKAINPSVDGIVAISRHSLVVDGKTLNLVEKVGSMSRFADVARRCETVLCCRMSPLHKAKIVGMAKGFPGKPVCAAVGDGANDVSMIQEAHLGIGIMGKEGRQAVRCSDFAFAKFRFLKKAILVHGHWYYYRISFFIMYVIYKNLAYASPQLYFARDNLFSAATLFESLYLQGFNLVFTALPIICYGVMEQNFPKEKLLDEPELYRNIAGNKYMQIPLFLGWCALAYIHSLVYFYLPYGAALLFGALDGSGTALLSGWDFGVLVMTISVVVINVKLYVLTKYWTKCTHVVYWGTMLVFLLFSLVYSALPRSAPVYLSFIQTFSLPMAWLILFITVAACVIPDVVIQIVFALFEKRRNAEIVNKRSNCEDKHSFSSSTPLMVKKVKFDSKPERVEVEIK